MTTIERTQLERMGADPQAVIPWVQSNGDPGLQMFQSMLLAKVVPNCRKLGILDAGVCPERAIRLLPATT